MTWDWEARNCTSKLKGFNCVRTALEAYAYYLGHIYAPGKCKLISNELFLHFMNVKLSSPSNIINEFVFLHWKRRKIMRKVRPREKKVKEIILKSLYCKHIFWTQKGSRSETSVKKSTISATLINLQVTEITLWLYRWKAEVLRNLPIYHRIA